MNSVKTFFQNQQQSSIKYEEYQILTDYLNLKIDQTQKFQTNIADVKQLTIYQPSQQASII